MPDQRAPPAGNAPFDTHRLDALMEGAGLDVVVASSRHNVQYCLGGYRFFFFEWIDALATSRYLPLVVYEKGRADDALYVGSIMEGVSQARGELWMRNVAATSWGSTDAMAAAVAHLKAVAGPVGTIGIEAGFLPSDAKDLLAASFPEARITDANRVFERLRAVKTPAEIELLRTAAEGIVDAMLATFEEVRTGMTKLEIAERLRRNQFARGVDFNFCQLTIGASLDRVPSSQRLHAGEVISLDSSGSHKGYVGDLCRMGVAGAPDAELEDLLADVDRVQQAARGAVRAGVTGGSVLAEGDRAAHASPWAHELDFTVHGLGLVNHEAPRLAHGRPVPYPADDADIALEVGVVLSIETAIKHPRRGFIKLEDTLAVTGTGCEALGDASRGWHPIGGG